MLVDYEQELNALEEKVGSGGDRFTIRVNGKQTFLFFERCAEFYVNCESPIIGRWFVERK
ncbi:MAG: hypothetical protein VB064_07760 [Oscillospiraceae bacterium]|nr:hypothetical protein [Oscillospiraceae bacterium]